MRSCAMESGTTFLSPHTKKQQYEKKMGTSAWTITISVPFFTPTKASQPIFIFDESGVQSNNKTVDKVNKGDNRDTTDNNNYENNDDRFYGMAI